MRRRIAHRVLAGALVLMASVPGLPVPAADHQVESSISGTVTTVAGAPLQGICVVAEPTIPAGPAVETITAADGTYLLAPVAAGVYTVGFSDCGRDVYVDAWYDGASTRQDAQQVVVGPDPVTAIDAAMRATGSISGRVTDTSGAALAGICVTLLPDEATTGPTTTTGADGRYGFVGLEGTFVVRYQDCRFVTPGRYATEYYDDAPTFAAATPLTVGIEAGAADVDAALAATASIAGTVRNADGPLANICVGLQTTAGADTAYQTRTLADGRYLLGHLDPGTYVVRFTDCDVMGYAHEWHANARSVAAATPLAVNAGGLMPGIDVTLEPASAIGGTVRDDAGEPLEGICVSPFGPDGTPSSISAVTDADGAYRLWPLQPDTWRVFARACSGQAYLPRWHQSGIDFETASPVVAPVGGDRSAIDVTLPVGIPDPCEDTAGADADADGLEDCREALVYGTSPQHVDSDGDLYGDGFEVHGGTCAGLVHQGGSDPADTTSTPPTRDTPVPTGLLKPSPQGRPALCSKPAADVTPPTIPVPEADIINPFQTATTFKIGWRSSDDRGGAVTYDVRVKTANAGQPFGTPYDWIRDSDATSSNFFNPPGGTVCAKMRARDASRNRSAWSPWWCTAIPFDDTALTASSGWVRTSVSGSYFGKESWHTTTNATLTLPATTYQRIALLASRCSGCGAVAVYSGSTLLRTVSLSASSTVVKQVIPVVDLAAPTTSAQTITIKVTSTGGKSVRIDGLHVSMA